MSQKIRIGNTDTNYELKVNSDGSLNVGAGPTALPVDIQYAQMAPADALPTYRVPRRTITTIASAIAVSPTANTGDIPLGLDGSESEVWLAVNIDKQPWTLTAATIFGGISYGTSIFPTYVTKATAFATAWLPAMALVIGISAADSGLTAATTMQEAKALLFPYDPNMSCRLVNGHATDTANVTIRVVRVWR